MQKEYTFSCPFCTEDMRSLPEDGSSWHYQCQTNGPCFGLRFTVNKKTSVKNPAPESRAIYERLLAKVRGAAAEV